MVRDWTRTDTVRLLRVPTADDDKYSRGVVGLRTGSAAYPGAAVLGVEAAWRAGAGYVLYTGGARDAVLARRPETVARADPGRTRVDAWVIGSGTDAGHRGDDERSELQRILHGGAPVVVDAGALDLAGDATAPLVLTPHAGELARLRSGLGLAEAPLAGADERVSAAREVAERLSATMLLKGATTLVVCADDDALAVRGAPAWLSTAGTGDVLAGVLAALIAANPQRPLREAAAAAASLHAHAAALASGTADGAEGHPIVALDVAEALPAAISDLRA